MAKNWTGVDYVFQPGELPIRRATPRAAFTPRYHLLTEEQLPEFLRFIKTQTRGALDTETTSLYIDVLDMVSVNIHIAGITYIWYTKHNKAYVLDEETHDLQRQIIEAMLNLEVCYLFNARFDLLVFRKQYGINVSDLRNICDVQSLIFLADTNIKMSKLKDAERTFLGLDPKDFDFPDILEADPTELNEYQAFDGYGTYELGELFYPVLKARYNLPVEADRRIISPLLTYEDNEFNLVKEELERILDQIKDEAEATVEQIFSHTRPFHIGSNKALAAVLKEGGFDTGILTKGGDMSVATDALLSLGDSCPIAKLVIKWRKLTKLSTSYIQPLLFRLNRGIPIRFRYLLNNVPTGRLAAGSYSAKNVKKSEKHTHYYCDMNFQALSKPLQVKRTVYYDERTYQITYDRPKDDDPARDWLKPYLVETGLDKLNLRKGFGTPDDQSGEWLWCAIDFSGQELRIAANLSLEQVWIDALMHGRDLHEETAKAIWGAANYDKNKRKKAKIANFACLFGGNEYTLAKKLGISLAEATDFYNKYRQALPRLFEWFNEVHNKARRFGYVITPFGVPRRLKFYYSLGRRFAGYADRSAVNTLVQGSAGMMMRICLIQLHRLINVPGGEFYGDAQFRGTIHDEIDFVVKKSRLREFVDKVTYLMEHSGDKNWPVSMEVEVSIGNNWGEVFPINHKSYPYMPKVIEEENVKAVLAVEDIDSDAITEHLVAEAIEDRQLIGGSDDDDEDFPEVEVNDSYLVGAV